MAWAARAFACLFAAAAGAAARSAQAADGPGKAPQVESAAERRAVRGVPVEDQVRAESPELREVRRFEEEAFPRDFGPKRPRPDDAPLPLPPGLDGRWGGSGDVGPELRSPAVSRRVAAAAAAPPADWRGRLALPEIPVRWEPQVLRWLDFFGKDPRGRTTMASFLRKLGRFRALFDRTLGRHGLPKDLVYLAMIESGFEPGAISRVGAGGVWQFMPGVARAYGLEVSHWVDARRDPERAVEAASRYLKDLHVRFGHWHLAFAGFHAGYHGVLRSITRYNTNDYWELCRHEAGLPWETTHYVPKILAAAIIGHNPSAFGFGEVVPDPPWEYETVQVPPGTALAAVARAAGARPEVIEALNPDLIRGRTPPDRGPLGVRVPVGSAKLYAQTHERARSPSERAETVVLRFGETMEDVARDRGTTLRELKKLNGVANAADVRPGTAILVPPRTGSSGPAVAKPTAGGVVDDDTVLVGVPDRSFASDGRERVFYRTRDGDTLADVAGVFGVTIDDLVDWNHIDPDAKLHAKLVLQVFVRKDFDAEGVALLDPAKVRVVTLGSEEFLELEAARRGKTRLAYQARAGDTLTKIARRYGLAPGDLARINRLSSTADLSEGQRVIVYSPTPELPREITVGRSAPHRPRPLATKAALTKAPVGKPAVPTKPAARR